MKLATKASLLITIMVMVLFVPVSSVVLHFQEDLLRKATFNTVDAVVKNAALLVASVVENAHRSANALAATLPVEALHEGHLEPLEAHLKKGYDTQNFRNGIFLLDPRGKVLLDYPAHPDMRGRAMAFREYFVRTMAERRGVVSEPYISARTGKPVLTVTAPILGGDGSVLAVLACSYDLLDPGVLGGIRDQRLGRTGYMYLFDRSRLMILHPDSKRILKRDIPLGANKVLDKAIEGYEGPGATINSRGIPMLASFRQVPGTPWILGAQIPEAEAFEATASSRRLMLRTTALSLVLLLVVGVFTVRYFARPLGQLHQAARAIALDLEGGGTGRGIIPMLASIQSKDEIGTLAQTFRELVERQHQSLDLLKRAASEWERTFDAVHEAILCLDLDGRILQINRVASDLLRISPEAASGRSGKALVLGAEADAGFWPQATSLDAEHAQSWTSPLPHREGVYEFRAAPVVQEGVLSGMILAVRDVTERAQQEEDIRKQAFLDALTGLPNRILLMDRLQQALVANTRAGRGVAVLFLDLDHFKQVNDTKGHDVGDALLRETALRLGALIRRNDTVARLGGDEFVIVISDIGGRAAAELVATKVIQSLAAAFLIQGHALHVGTSIGIAMAPEDGTEGLALLKHADAAMYQAKREGRSTFRHHSAEPPGPAENA